jgi:acyl-homoserine-lactone acylase
MMEERAMYRSSSPGRIRKIWFFPVILLLFWLVVGGCSKIVSRMYRQTGEELTGTVRLPSLTQPVTVRRDGYGIPYIEAKNMEDLARAIGYVNAADRIGQMYAFKLLSQGRISEMAGPVGLDLDIYMRTLGIPRIGEKLMKNVSPETRKLLNCYCEGVNAWLEQNRDRLPATLALSGYRPEPWRPMDSLTVSQIVNLALSFNIHEEVGMLSVMQAIGPEKTAWLLPVYPDEPLPFEEAAKLKGIDFKRTAAVSARLAGIRPVLKDLGLGGIAASNNWAISPGRTAGGSSIFANDTHLVLSMPSLWTFMHVKCGSYEAAGVNLPGIPSIIAGYNGHIAWGMTMVMGDNQDVFLEQIKDMNGVPHYLYKGQWLPVTQRKEKIIIKGKDPATVTISETRHGPLLNSIFEKEPASLLQPARTSIPYGIALGWAAVGDDDRTIDACFRLSFASSVEEAVPIVKQIRAMALNMVFADKDNIAWQMTGTYPVRAKGRGLMPSPGWTGEYDWTGILYTDSLPYAVNPPQGFVGTANNRTISGDYPLVISSSWYWPERAERIAQLVLSTDRHTSRTSMDMQNDTHSLFVPKLKDKILNGPLSLEIKNEINSWKDEAGRARVLNALEMLSRFDGNLSADSPDAAIVGAFLNCATENIFLDELGPEDSNAWKGFLELNNASYNATCDHILVRGDESPFWDDVTTKQRETRAQILAASLRDAFTMLESELGKDRSQWRWGTLHTYTWETESSKMAKHMGITERIAMWSLWSYFNRGPYPAPGDHCTLNVSAYLMGQDFDTWLIPAMRIIVDFGLEEPMHVMNSSGQSDNPSSSHYDDEIAPWLRGDYIPMPFGEEAVKKQYDKVLVLKP